MDQCFSLLNLRWTCREIKEKMGWERRRRCSRSWEEVTARGKVDSSVLSSSTVPPSALCPPAVSLTVRHSVIKEWLIPPPVTRPSSLHLSHFEYQRLNEEEEVIPLSLFTDRQVKRQIHLSVCLPVNLSVSLCVGQEDVSFRLRFFLCLRNPDYYYCCFSFVSSFFSFRFFCLDSFWFSLLLDLFLFFSLAHLLLLFSFNSSLSSFLFQPHLIWLHVFPLGSNQLLLFHSVSFLSSLFSVLI